jgi:hypothetical protein
MCLPRRCIEKVVFLLVHGVHFCVNLFTESHLVYYIPSIMQRQLIGHNSLHNTLGTYV